jgi:hypothetical protein
VVLAAGLAAGAAGCALPGKTHGSSGLSVDPHSEVAQHVAYASSHPGPYPKFSQIPPLPRDVRPPSAYRAAVLDMTARRQALEGQTAALPPPETDAEDVAGDLRSRLPNNEPPPAEDAQQQTEAYGRALRERATPPPPPR